MIKSKEAKLLGATNSPNNGLHPATPQERLGWLKGCNNFHGKKLLRWLVPNSLIPRKIKLEKQNCILFTFDDGPNKQITPQILSILDDYEVRAIFFLVGRFAKEHPEIVREIKRRGHFIGNHSFNHPNRRIFSYSENLAELTSTQELLLELTGEEPSFFRPPLGLVSPIGFFLSERMKLKTILWSYSTDEWGRRKGMDARTIASHATSSIRNGDIVLMHDDNEKSTEILKLILPKLKEAGFNFAPDLLW